MTRRLAHNVLLASASLFLSLGVAEVAVRVFGFVDADGNSTACGRCQPLRMPIVETRKHVEAATKAGVHKQSMYDSLLGWVPRPGSADGWYRYNSQSIRAPIEYATQPADGLLRIALFGDSFIYGDEVPFEQTLGFFLERQLRAAGYRVEVLNFGVPGYGTDQAFLRWRGYGKTFSPHIVIQGLYMENVRRNVNLVRPIYFPATGIAYSKPRFILQDDTLTLINVPPIPPDQLPELMTDFGSWGLARHEYFFRPEMLRASAWMTSDALAFLYQRLLPRTEPPFSYALSDEPARVTLRILQQFKQEAEAEGSRFMAVYLPDASEVTQIMRADRLVFADLLARIGEQIDLIDPGQQLADQARQSSVRELFQIGHYSGNGNRLVAGAVAAHLQRYLHRVPE